MTNFNNGERFGLPPIGISESTLATGPSDTKREAFPSLATKGSVFSWVNPFVTIFNFTGTPNSTITAINLRNNTATGGSSTDVPTWATGAVVGVNYQVTVFGGAVTQQSLSVFSGYDTSTSVYQVAYSALPTSFTNVQVIVPFYDEPIVNVTVGSAGAAAGTVSCLVKLQGFVRNV